MPVVNAGGSGGLHELTPIGDPAIPGRQHVNQRSRYQRVIPRFTNDIWPAVVACNGACDQGGARHAKFTKIVVPGLDAGHYGSLRDAVQKLGTVQEAGQSHGGIYRDDELHLADTSLTALNPPTAVLQVCYSFTARSNPAGSQQPKLEPAASEATVELRKTDNWYLYSITNDHVVPGCPASPKA